MPSNISLHLGDCLEVLRSMPADSVDSVVTDPPYGLSFMGKRWDYDVPATEIWRECLRVLKPGGHLLAFAGTRTQHRMAVNIEDAGFEIRDMIAWVYGSGFPKSLDVSKAIDKANGKHDRDLQPFADYVKACRIKKGWSLRQLDEAMGTNTASSWWEGRKSGIQPPGLIQYQKLKNVLGMDDRFDELIVWLEAEREVVGQAEKPIGHSFAGDRYTDAQGIKTVNITAPATESAKKWQGWGTALKPALEPITVARKPLVGTVAENVLEHGTGAINVDGCRVGVNGGCKTSKLVADGKSGPGSFTVYREPATVVEGLGRWPANLIHDGSDEVVGLTGSAARFFYCSKANKQDRDEGNRHPTVKPTDLMRYLVRLVTPPNGTVLDPFMGSGSTGKACVLEGFSFVGIEREAEYLAISRARIAAAQAKQSEELPLG